MENKECVFNELSLDALSYQLLLQSIISLLEFKHIYSCNSEETKKEVLKKVLSKYNGE